jgi:hypothetical protein
MPILRMGHAPGHVRDTACAAFEKTMEWRGQGPEPTVDFEINYEPHPIPISRACGMVSNCTDIVPGNLFDRLRSDMEQFGGKQIRRCTYAACARAILEYIKENRAAV